MTDKIFVKNLILPCKVGVSEEERKRKQNLIIDIEISCDLANAGTSDDLKKSINYAEIREKVTELLIKSEFKLLESLAENVASLILMDAKASRVTIEVKKQKYSAKPSMGIQITRDRVG